MHVILHSLSRSLMQNVSNLVLILTDVEPFKIYCYTETEILALSKFQKTLIDIITSNI